MEKYAAGQKAQSKANKAPRTSYVAAADAAIKKNVDSLPSHMKTANHNEVYSLPEIGEERKQKAKTTAKQVREEKQLKALKEKKAHGGHLNKQGSWKDYFNKGTEKGKPKGQKVHPEKKKKNEVNEDGTYFNAPQGAAER